MPFACTKEVHLLGLLFFTIWASSSAGEGAGGPVLLTVEELQVLSEPIGPDSPASAHLDRVLSAPFTSNAPGPADAPAGTVRVAFWNIGHSREWFMIQTALRAPEEFRAQVSRERSVTNREWEQAARQISMLRSADVIVLNEVDLGMPRSGYADVAYELARALGMNYTFGVEFVEVGGLAGEVDPIRYRGLHGNAILSRFPIRSAAIRRLRDCYDWFQNERNDLAPLEKGKRWVAKRLLREDVVRQVRRGGRMALIAELDIPGPVEALTVVGTHLEEKATPECRHGQMNDLLEAIRHAPGAVLVAGDLNTSGRDGRPSSFRKELARRLTSTQFWARHAVDWAVPAVSIFMRPINFWKNAKDPTAVNIPVIARNSERNLFELLRQFRFSDGGTFDFGDGNGASGTLGNTNDRDWKGFRPTREVAKHLLSFAGDYRLDWIFVKPGADRAGRPLMRAENPQTLQKLNKLPSRSLSDHHPITVDLLPTEDFD